MVYNISEIRKVYDFVYIRGQIMMYKIFLIKHYVGFFKRATVFPKISKLNIYTYMFVP